MLPLILVARQVVLHGDGLFNVVDGGISDLEMGPDSARGGALDLLCAAFGDVSDLGSHHCKVTGADEDGNPLLEHEASFSWARGPYPREIFRVPLLIPRKDARYIFTLRVDELPPVACDLRTQRVAS